MPHRHFEPEWDAQTLAEAAAIETDPRRAIAARAEADRLARVKAEEAAKLAALVKNVPVRNEKSAPAVMQSGDGRVLPVTRSTR